MGKFNEKVKEKTQLVSNYAGGDAHQASKKLELASILLTSFVEEQFYRSSSDTLERLRVLLQSIDPLFSAKLAIYARDRFGMRSISHALAAEIAPRISGANWGKNFYDKVVVRPDDMTEIMAYYSSLSKDQKVKFPNSMKKGFAEAFNRFDSYQIAKYKGDKNRVKLVDVVNLVHPVPTKNNTEALHNLINGTLKTSGTWESMMTKAGQESSDVEELTAAKANVWGTLISERKLGYMALLKNLRNIITQAPEVLGEACVMLEDQRLISKSRVLPFRYATAFEEISKLPQDNNTRKVLVSISNALDNAVSNVPLFDGDTLVALDVSGSMQGKPSDISSLFAAVLAKRNMCDIITFDTNARYVAYDPTNSVLGIRKSFTFTGGGTNFHNIFRTANKAYKRIILLSDMQAWMGRYTPREEFNSYSNRYGKPLVYSWDMSGYGSLQFPENNVYALAGFSDKVFDVIAMLENDKMALLNEIERVEI